MILLLIGIGIGLVAGIGLGLLFGLRIERKFQAFLCGVQTQQSTQLFSRYYITEEGIRDASKDYSEF